MPQFAKTTKSKSLKAQHLLEYYHSCFKPYITLSLIQYQKKKKERNIDKYKTRLKNKNI